MATSDLCAELNKNAELGPYLESRCATAAYGWRHYSTILISTETKQGLLRGAQAAG